MIEQPERIAKAEIDQGAQRSALRLRHQDLADPFGRIVHILIGGRDVVVPKDSDVGVRLEFAREPGLERPVPRKFVDILFAIERLTVRAVGTNHADPLIAKGQCDREHAALVVFKVGDLAHDIDALFTRQHGNAVVGFLAGPGRVVANFGKRIQGKLVLIEFELLQAEGIHGVRGQPVEYLGQAYFQ